jgi:hypothetical protein
VTVTVLASNICSIREYHLYCQQAMVMVRESNGSGVR